MKMLLVDALTCLPYKPFLSLGFSPSRVTAGFTHLTLALFVGVKKKKMSTSTVTSLEAQRERRNRRVAGWG